MISNPRLPMGEVRPRLDPFFAALEELPPAFALSALVGVLVSLLDKPRSEG
ncbi:MAG: hypothetical protein HRU14_04475 [Planctomycetes bacterium]|nr:hypothetical protein [Planctomycetota bacterium]